MDFIGDLYAYYPRIGYPWRAAALGLGVFMLLAMWRQYRLKKITLYRAGAISVLTVYLFLVFSSTVFSRVPGMEYEYELELFWSYRQLFSGQLQFGKEIVYNMLMLMPVGILLPVALPKCGWKMTVGAGFGCTVLIEVLQLIAKRGLFEFDDILHNTFGTAAGYGIFLLCRRAQKRR